MMDSQEQFHAETMRDVECAASVDFAHDADDDYDMSERTMPGCYVFDEAVGRFRLEPLSSE